MKSEYFDYLSVLNEPDINKKLWESSFFYVNFYGKQGPVSRVLENLGYTAEDMLSGDYIQSIHKDDRTTYKNLLKRFYAGQDDHLNCEFRIQSKKDGEWHWIFTQAFVIKRNEEGRIRKIFGIDRNISAVKKIEDYYQNKLFEFKTQVDLYGLHLSKDVSNINQKEFLEKIRGIIPYSVIKVCIEDKGEYHCMIDYSPAESPESTRTIELNKILTLMRNTSNPVIIDDKDTCSPWSNLLILPLNLESKKVGYAVLCHYTEGIYKGTDLLLLKGFSNLFTLMIQNTINKQAEKDVQQRLHNEEHRKIARELHDGIAQNLASIKMITEQLADERMKEGVSSEELQLLHRMVQNTLKEVRILSEGLRLSADSEYIDEQLEIFCKKIGNYYAKKVFFVKKTRERHKVSSDYAEHILRIIHEAVSNSNRHSTATEIIIELSVEHSNLVLRVKDNGNASGTFTEGMGMKGIRERVSLMKGEVTWDTGDDTGTIMTLIVPD